MAKNLALKNPTFDYSPLSKEEKQKLHYFEGALVRSRQKVAAELVKHGETLYGAQEVLAHHGDGTFRAWLDSVGISHTSAYRAIDVYVQFGDCPNWDKLEVSAAYTLAKNEKAKLKALTLIEKGLKVTHAMAKQLIAAVTPAPPKSDSDDKPLVGTPVEIVEPTEPADETLGFAESPRQGRKSPPKTPPKKLDRGAYWKQWEQAIAPVVKLVDRIAEGLGERQDPHQVDAQEYLESATSEIAEWLGVE